MATHSPPRRVASSTPVLIPSPRRKLPALPRPWNVLPAAAQRQIAGILSAAVRRMRVTDLMTREAADAADRERLR
jgi:hypothetical protein